MHVKAKRIAVSGLMLALTVVFISMGSIIETNTLFLLAAASYFVGIIIREFQIKTGFAFYLAGVLLGFMVSPNKLYVITYAAMGLYILIAEIVWKRLENVDTRKNRKAILIGIKYFVFNIMYIPIIVLFNDVLFVRKISPVIMIGLIVAGQIGLFIYDRAYMYVQGNIWNKLRGRMLQ